MQTHRLLFSITIVNAGLLMYSLVHPRVTSAQDPTPVLRGRAFEIVDDRGRVRGEIKIFPADPKVKMPDGTIGYPETVLFRLMDSKGRPTVKIAATEDGSAINLGGESDPTGIQQLARGKTTLLKLTNKDGKEQLIKP